MATTAEVYAPIEAPPTEPRPHGLFSVSPPDDGGERWRLGVGMQSWNCIDAGIWNDVCIDGGADLPKSVTAWLCDVTEFDPFTVYYMTTRSGIDISVAESQASGAFQAAEERSVEGKLWGNMLAAATDGGATATVEIGLASVEFSLAQNYNGVGAIHVSAYTATLMAHYIENRDGNLVTKACGTPVIIGAGYGPVLENTIIGTGRPFVRRGELETLTAWDLSVNDIRPLAERTYLAGWDCYAIKTTIT